MQIHYGLSCDAALLFDSKLRLVASQKRVRSVCEVGGGANPALDTEFVRRHKLDYTIVDISADELAKAPRGFRTIQADITRADHGIPGTFDLVFSVWCAEHVPDAAAFHQHVFDLLNDGGMALHLFPTMYSPPFVANRLFPEMLSSRMLRWLQPHRDPDGNHGKFPAYYDWCRGPHSDQLRRFEQIGFEVEEYSAFFGHSGRVAFGAGYLDRLPMLCRMHEQVCDFLRNHPNPWLTTVAFVVLRKPTCSATVEKPDRDECVVADAEFASV